MRADPLLRFRVVLAGIANDLDQGRRPLLKSFIEEGRLGAEGLSPRLHQLEAYHIELVLPAGDDILELWEGIRPLVGPFESPVAGNIRPLGDRVALRADVDLLPPIRLAEGELAADAGVAAKVRALQVLNLHLVCFGQVEEVASGCDDALKQILWNPVPGQVKESVLVGRFAQLFAERGGLFLALVEAGQIENREGKRGGHS